MKRKEIGKNITDVFVIAVGCALYAVGFSAFIGPNSIAAGGATGIAAVINFYFNKIPVGTAILVINIPLFVIGFRKFKFSFVIRSAAATVFASVFIDLYGYFFNAYSGDKILAALAGGVTTGVGLALVLMRGATTGGTDIVAKLLNLKFRFLSIGRLILLVDALIVGVSALSYGSFESVLYSVLYLFTMSVVMDKLIYGSDRVKTAYIITQKPKNMIDDIVMLAGRGVTQIKVLGGYTQTERTMLLCAARPQELPKIISIIKKNDENAFVIVGDAGEIFGEGFKKIES